MKNITKYRLFIAVLAVGISLGLTMSLWGGASNKAKISYLEGKAFKGKSKTGPWNALKQGDKLTAGSVIKTEEKGRVELLLPDKSILRIAPRSVFQISHSLFPKKKKTRSFSAKLWIGSIWSRVSKKFRGETKFKIKTKTAVAGVRGTVWSINAEDSGASMFKVYNGKVAVTPPGEEVAKAEEKKPVAGEREEMAFPEEISKKEWFELLLTRMQGVKIGADGKPGETFAIDPEKDKDEWAAWNMKRDAELEKQAK